jgi:hypothetical protein
MNSIFLTQAEVDDLCAPLIQPAAQVRFLRASGLTVTVKPNGRAAVVRSHAEQVLSFGAVRPAASVGQPADSAAKPDRGALISLFNRGGGTHGATKKAQPA